MIQAARTWTTMPTWTWSAASPRSKRCGHDEVVKARHVFQVQSISVAGLCMNIKQKMINIFFFEAKQHLKRLPSGKLTSLWKITIFHGWINGNTILLWISSLDDRRWMPCGPVGATPVRTPSCLPRWRRTASSSLAHRQVPRVGLGAPH